MAKFEFIRGVLCGAGIAIIIFFSVILVQNFGNIENRTSEIPTGFAVLPPNDVANKVLSLINKNLENHGTKASLVKVEEISGVYKIITEYQGNKIPVYATKDGKWLFPEAISLSPCETLVKSENPKLEAFVVSYCPFGLQMLRILNEIVKNIPELENYIEVRYIGGISDGKVISMHGEKEAEENLRQICIREEQEDKFWAYISCFIKDGNASRCLNEAKIDVEKLRACMQDENRGLKYAEKDFELQNNYRVSGSPTLVLNGERVSEFEFGGRTANAVKTLLCCGFVNPPKYCSQNITNLKAAIGFSSSYSSGTTSSGQC